MGAAQGHTRANGRGAGFVDLHVHLLPGVDDGPRDVDATIELARLAVADGIVVATTTPHVASVAVAEIPARVDAVNEALTGAGVDLEVQCGGELSARGVERLTDSELETIAHGPAGARWILLEAPLDGAVGALHRGADQLRARGFGVVLAHPERCAPLFDDDLRGLRRELELGSLVQVSSSSIVGLHGARSRRNAVRLLTGRHVDLLATDAHGVRRPPSLTAALRAAFRLGLPECEVLALVGDRPRALLRDGLRACVRAPEGEPYVAGRDAPAPGEGSSPSGAVSAFAP
jgi:protein-tyrosine phosphatase